MQNLKYYLDSDLIELASYDDADSYEVDEGGILLDLKNKKLIFVSASGCSCWDGDYEESKFNTWDELSKFLVNDETKHYYAPSLYTRQYLLEEGFEKFKNYSEQFYSLDTNYVS